MNEKPNLSDEAIHALLEKRAGLPDVAVQLAAVRSAAAATPQRRRSPFMAAPKRTSTLVGAAGLAALVLVLVGVGLASRPPSIGTPTGSPLVASGSPGPNLSPVPDEAGGPIVLTVDELNGLIATDLGALSGRILIIDGVINGIGLMCTSGLVGTCFEASAYLDRSNPRLAVGPVTALGPGPWNGSPPLAGAFAATLVSGTLNYRGPVTLTSDLAALLPSQLPDPSNVSLVAENSYWLVHGWIAGLGVVPSCPSAPGLPLAGGPQYTCGGLPALLSDDSRQPVEVTSSGFSVDGGAGSVVVQNGAYDKFATAPLTIGLQTRPEEATFLVEQSGLHWAIVARIDPTTVLIATPGPSPLPSVSPRPILPLSVAQADALFSHIRGPLQVVITGTIGRDPPNSGCRLSPAACREQVLLLGSYAPTFAIYPIVGGAPLPSKLPYHGTFAAEMDLDSFLSYEGLVATAADGTAILPSQLPPLTASADPDSLWLVQGWIAGLEAALPCPLVPDFPPAGPQYGCGSTASLSDTDSQPVSDLKLNVPDDGVRVQNGAYDAFAPDPQSKGYMSIPEQATFLVKLVSVPCPPGTLCSFASGHRWQIVARIDPWPEAAQP